MGFASGVLRQNALQERFTGLLLHQKQALSSHVQTCLHHVGMCPEPVQLAFQAGEALAR
jgi:hypothetical protein